MGTLWTRANLIWKKHSSQNVVETADHILAPNFSDQELEAAARIKPNGLTLTVKNYCIVVQAFQIKR